MHSALTAKGAGCGLWFASTVKIMVGATVKSLPSSRSPRVRVRAILKRESLNTNSCDSQQQGVLGVSAAGWS